MNRFAKVSSQRKWGFLPSCWGILEITCGYPGIVKNGYSIGNQYFYNDKISFKCFDGFSMMGGSTIVCKEDGKWFPALPKCIGKPQITQNDLMMTLIISGIQCTLPTVPNGKIIISEAAEESRGFSGVNRVDSDTQIRVKCSSNFTLKGDPMATCLEDGAKILQAIQNCFKPVNSFEGTWNTRNFSCEFIARPTLNCPLNLVPAAPENGFLDENSLQAMQNGVADFVEYKCRSGYFPVGVNISTCIVDGYWTEPNITCQGTLPSL